MAKPESKSNKHKKEINMNRLESDGYVSFEWADGEAKRVLFVGNSITRHGVCPPIGWLNDWGMAASDISKDYVHRTSSILSEKYGPVSIGITNCGDWEREYWKDGILENHHAARDFGADIVVIRIGENIDRSKLAQHDLAGRFEDMIRYFASSPSAKVIVTDLFWHSEALDALIVGLCRKNGWTFVTIGDLGDKPEMKALGLFEHQGVANHPSDEGMEQIARRICDAALS